MTFPEFRETLGLVVLEGLVERGQHNVFWLSASRTECPDLRVPLRRENRNDRFCRTRSSRATGPGCIAPDAVWERCSTRRPPGPPARAPDRITGRTCSGSGRVRRNACSGKGAPKQSIFPDPVCARTPAHAVYRCIIVNTPAAYWRLRATLRPAILSLLLAPDAAGVERAHGAGAHFHHPGRPFRFPQGETS